MGPLRSHTTVHRGRITHTLLILYLHPQTTLPEAMHLPGRA